MIRYSHELAEAVLATGGLMTLSRDDILRSAGPVTEAVDVPEWGGKVLVRGMTGTERDAWEGSLIESRGKRSTVNTANVRAKLAVACIVDEAGQRVFMPGDAAELGAKSAAALNRVYEVAARLSGISDEDVESLTVNFGGTTGDDSSSASPPASTSPSEPSSTSSTPTS